MNEPSPPTDAGERPPMTTVPAAPVPPSNPTDTSAAAGDSPKEGGADAASHPAPRGGRRRRGRRGQGRERGEATTPGAGADAGTVDAPRAAGAQAAAPATRSKSRTQPAPRGGVDPVLETLARLHPHLFGARFLPLKRGIFEDLLARHPDELQAESLKRALGLHARSSRYLEAVASGLGRHDLDGHDVEAVAPEHVLHAIAETHRRRRARRPEEDFADRLKNRLLRAIAASGLERDDYLALAARHTDPDLQDALAAAFAERAQRAARHEALRRAFEGSGKSAAEFAEMYGMPLAEVQAALRRPPAAKPAAPGADRPTSRPGTTPASPAPSAPEATQAPAGAAPVASMPAASRDAVHDPSPAPTEAPVPAGADASPATDRGDGADEPSAGDAAPC